MWNLKTQNLLEVEKYKNIPLNRLQYNIDNRIPPLCKSGLHFLGVFFPPVYPRNPR